MENFYPALYYSANQASLNAQKNYIGNIIAYLILTILGTTLSFFVIDFKIAGICAIFIFLFTLAITIYQAYKRFDKEWYTGRALAESIKTRTWRFVMKTEPYDQIESFDIDKKEFCKDLEKIFKQNTSLGNALLSDNVLSDNLTQEMLTVRNLDSANRLKYYVKNRIDEQREWYFKKAKHNKQMEKRWFISLIIFHTLILALLVFQIGYKTEKLPTEIIIVLVSSILTWIQVKKYQDLSTSYALTAHEIGIIKSQSFLAHGSDEKLSNYVKDSENAFSREHTQWVARKDN